MFLVLGGLHLLDIRLRDAELLGVEQREMHPLHDVEPLVVALAHDRAERLLGDDLRQHDVIVGVGERQAGGVEARGVGRVGVAAPGVIGGVHVSGTARRPPALKVMLLALK